MVGGLQRRREFFLAPADNCAEAMKHPEAGLTLAKVATIDDALNALAASAPAAPPTCTNVVNSPGTSAPRADSGADLVAGPAALPTEVAPW